MSKTQKKGSTDWKRMTPRISPGEWLKALGIAVAMGLLACAAVFLLPAELSEDNALPVVINRLMKKWNVSACLIKSVSNA